MDLHQIDAVGAQQLHRALHLGDTGVAAGGPDLGRHERLVAGADPRKQIAHDRL